MLSAKSIIKNQKNYIYTLILLITVFIFEYFSSPFLIPAYTNLQTYRIILTLSGVGVVFISGFFPNKSMLFEIIFLIVFSFTKIDEVLYILPKIHSPGLFLSIFIFTNFLSFYILIFFSNFRAAKIMPGLFLLFSLVYEFLYFEKLKDIPPIIEILIITTTISTAAIARLINMEQRKRKVIRNMYNEEVILKEKIALMKGRMMEQEKSFSLSMLSAGIAHELGNPINYLQGNLFFIEDYFNSLIKMVKTRNLDHSDLQSFNKIVQEYKLIIEHSKTGFSTITNIIENMKQIYGQEHTSRKKIDINQILIRTIDFFKISHPDRNYTIESFFTPNLFVSINPGEYYIVFSNILTNALEAIVPETEKGLISISTSKKDNFVNITISDNGCGLSRESESKVFDPFFSTKFHKHNLGLGLALCNEIIKTDKGLLTITSKKGKGTNITISIREYKDV